MRPAVSILTLLLSGCASNDVQALRPLEIATAPYQGVVTSALTGSLMYEGGCLLFRDEHDRFHLFPVWPDGSIFNGTSVAFHQPGKAEQQVVVGEEFVMEGQPIQWSRIPNPRIALHQQRCGSQPFAVLAIHPAN